MSDAIPFEDSVLLYDRYKIKMLWNINTYHLNWVQRYMELSYINYKT